MLPHQPLAAVLRTLRAMKGVTQSELPADRKHLYKLEAGLSDITLGMIQELAESLGVEPVTLVMLVRATEMGCSSQALLVLVADQLQDFERKGGPAELTRQLDLGAVQAREVARAERSSAIQACKERGLTQRETAHELGLSKSTVARAW
ncbi:helix-turn-helix domain-containing protein [Pseudomonas lutea]|uniref:Helix-turn-helix domain-containing protein n=1 Tax=Pseudomonas lutea TaxID=243924 RepID=A0ABR9AC42_9PSED|nr:helix-turn-helix transcriptional regulator [Pseudomonas lutea]MBD8123674.1 helix-turn-helix domain-containing protein [Pseudomonas lutea]